MLLFLGVTLVFQRRTVIILCDTCSPKPDNVTIALILCHYCVTTYDATYTNIERAY